MLFNFARNIQHGNLHRAKLGFNIPKPIFYLNDIGLDFIKLDFNPVKAFVYLAELLLGIKRGFQ